MAFFKFRKGAEEQSAPAPAPQSVETLRKRARHRLLGAIILVLAGVVGFPLLFDNQPRPIAVDIPIDIPDKAKTKPLAASVQPAVAAQVAASQSVLAADAAKDAKDTKEPAKTEEIIATSKPRADAASAAKSTDKPAAKASEAAKASDKPAVKSSDSAKAGASDHGRFIVQFGSYTDSAKAHDARVKVEKAGLKTYAQTIQSPDGTKYRVRVGPFDNRADAEKAAAKIKKLDLPTSILEL